MKIPILIAILFLLVSCKKDKLEGQYEVFQGKWKWVGATETRTTKSTGNSIDFQRDASEFPDDYFIEFERKGKVSFIKNQTTENAYRTVIGIFSENCNKFNNCHFFRINLNNNTTNNITGIINVDSLNIGSRSTNLPLQSNEDSEYSYTYAYDFVRVN